MNCAVRVTDGFSGKEGQVRIEVAEPEQASPHDLLQAVESAFKPDATRAWARDLEIRHFLRIPAQIRLNLVRKPPDGLADLRSLVIKIDLLGARELEALRARRLHDSTDLTTLLQRVQTERRRTVAALADLRGSRHGRRMDQATATSAAASRPLGFERHEVDRLAREIALLERRSELDGLLKTLTAVLREHQTRESRPAETTEPLQPKQEPHAPTTKPEAQSEPTAADEEGSTDNESARTGTVVTLDWAQIRKQVNHAGLPAPPPTTPEPTPEPSPEPAPDAPQPSTRPVEETAEETTKETSEAEPAQEDSQEADFMLETAESARIEQVLAAALQDVRTHRESPAPPAALQQTEPGAPSPGSISAPLDHLTRIDRENAERRSDELRSESWEEAALPGTYRVLVELPPERQERHTVRFSNLNVVEAILEDLTSQTPYFTPAPADRPDAARGADRNTWDDLYWLAAVHRDTYHVRLRLVPKNKALVLSRATGRLLDDSLVFEILTRSSIRDRDDVDGDPAIVAEAMQWAALFRPLEE